MTKTELVEILDGRTFAWLILKLKMPHSTFYWKLDNGFKREDIEKIKELTK